MRVRTFALVVLHIHLTVSAHVVNQRLKIHAQPWIFNPSVSAPWQSSLPVHRWIDLVLLWNHGLKCMTHTATVNHACEWSVETMVCCRRASAAEFFKMALHPKEKQHLALVLILSFCRCCFPKFYSLNSLFPPSASQLLKQCLSTGCFVRK